MPPALNVAEALWTPWPCRRVGAPRGQARGGARCPRRRRHPEYQAKGKREYKADCLAHTAYRLRLGQQQVGPVPAKVSLCRVFTDPLAIHRSDPDAQGEGRFIAVGMGSVGVVMVVVYTLRGDEIRLISARRATRHEVKDYEE